MKGHCWYIQYQENESWASFFSLKEEIYEPTNRSTYVKLINSQKLSPRPITWANMMRVKCPALALTPGDSVNE